MPRNQKEFIQLLQIIPLNSDSDVTVFDEAEMQNSVPDQNKAFGIRKVFINGRQVLSDGTLDTAALKTSGHAMPCR